MSVFYEDPIQSTDGRAEDRGLTTASGAASGAEAISQTVTRQVNGKVLNKIYMLPTHFGVKCFLTVL